MCEHWLNGDPCNHSDKPRRPVTCTVTFRTLCPLTSTSYDVDRPNQSPVFSKRAELRILYHGRSRIGSSIAIGDWYPICGVRALLQGLHRRHRNLQRYLTSTVSDFRQIQKNAILPLNLKGLENFGFNLAHSRKLLESSCQSLRSRKSYNWTRSIHSHTSNMCETSLRGTNTCALCVQISGITSAPFSFVFAKRTYCRNGQ